MRDSFGRPPRREDQRGMGTETRLRRQNPLASNNGYAEGKVIRDLLQSPPASGISTSVVRKLPKLERRVRFPYPAPSGYVPFGNCAEISLCKQIQAGCLGVVRR